MRIRRWTRIGASTGRSIALLLALPLGALAAEIRYEAAHVAMGSEYRIVVYGSNEAELAEICEAAFAEIDRLDDLLSNFKPSSELSMVRRLAATRPVRVTPEFFEFLRISDELRLQTFGAFDMTLGRGAIVLDGHDFTVRFTTPETKLDPGGIGKGLAVDHVIEILKQAGIKRALVDAGMSTINAIGTPPDDPRGWKINIRSPYSRSDVGAVVYLRDNSLSTSATYEKGRHIIDPRTHQPPDNGVLAVSSIAAAGTESDAITKCFFVLGRKGAAEYVKLHPGVRAMVCDPQCSWIP